MALKKSTRDDGDSNSIVSNITPTSRRSSNGVPNSPIPGSDFVILDEPKLQCIALIYGDSGTGKSTFVTQFCPQPVAFINFDGRAEFAIKKAKGSGRKILYTRVESPPNVLGMTDSQVKIAYQKPLDDTVRNFELACRAADRGDVRTICLDTATEYAEIVKLAITGRLDRKSDYGKSKDLINRQLSGLFQVARQSPAHLVILARAKATWEDNEPTGEFEPRGPAILLDSVDWAGQTKIKAKKRGLTTTKEFQLKITKAGTNGNLELGEVYTNSMWDAIGGPFIYSCINQYPETVPGDWK